VACSSSIFVTSAATLGIGIVPTLPVGPYRKALSLFLRLTRASASAAAAGYLRRSATAIAPFVCASLRVRRAALMHVALMVGRC
jgi:hypothetical protein